MAAHEYYSSSPYHAQSTDRLNAPLPPVPLSLETSLKPKDSSTIALSPLSSPFTGEYDATPQSDHDANSSYFEAVKANGQARDPFADDSTIPLQPQDPKQDRRGHYSLKAYRARALHDLEGRPRKPKRRKSRPFTKKSPWFIYILTLIQITVFIAEVVKNSVLTGSPIETQPQFNPMIGPSPYVLINMGARYVPCMRNEAGVQNANTTVAWPCPNQTNDTPRCTLSQLCGFNGVPLPHVNGSLDQTPAPNQWFRFVLPIFLHAGLIHIGFNMLLQVLLGGDMERAIGPVRVALVYFSSGIFGFVMGGNFAASGIASTGASGSLFGIIALTLLDLLYTWEQRRHPVRELCWILLDIILSFVLGLLPGLDNFSHIGGFLMGLVLGLCLLRSPSKLRQRTGCLDEPSKVGKYEQTRDKHAFDSPTREKDKSKSTKRKTVLSPPSSTRAFSHPREFFGNRKPLWWAWWLIRAAALVGVVAAFIVLVRAFYTHHDTECSWCKYLSCLPISNWCDIGDLTFTAPGSSGS